MRVFVTVYFRGLTILSAQARQPQAARSASEVGFRCAPILRCLAMQGLPRLRFGLPGPLIFRERTGHLLTPSSKKLPRPEWPTHVFPEPVYPAGPFEMHVSAGTIDRDSSWAPLALRKGH